MLHGSPWLYTYPQMSPNDHRTIAQGSRRVVGGHPEIAILQPTHAGLKTAKPSPVGPHRGTDLGSLEIAPKTPVIG